MENHPRRSDEPDSALIEQQLEHVQRAYLWLRQKIKPNIRRVSGNETDWYRLAEALARQRLDPYGYVQFCYDMFVTKFDDLYPHLVTDLKNVYRFASSSNRTGSADRLRVILRLQFLELEHQLGRGRELPDVLMDEDVSMSALFRYAVCKLFGLRRLAVVFEEEAQRMLTFKPAYRALLRGLLEGHHGSGGQPAPDHKASVGLASGTPHT